MPIWKKEGLLGTRVEGERRGVRKWFYSTCSSSGASQWKICCYGDW